MKKRLLSLLCVVCLLLTALPTGAFAVEGEETLPAVQAAEGGETKEKTPPDDRTDGEDGGQAPLVGAMTVTEFVTLDPDELDGFSDAELLEGYLYSVSGLYGGASPLRAPARPLTGETKTAYDLILPMIESVANGTEKSTVFTLTSSAWDRTPEDWGFTTPIAFSKGEELPQTVVNAISAKFDMNALFHRLLSDLPYHLYWFDKSAKDSFSMGVSLQYTATSDGTTSTITKITATVEIKMKVSKDYAVGGAENTYAVGDRPARVATAVAEAGKVVSNNASKSDYNKLEAYRKYITDAVSYNEDAAKKENNVPYGDPWQLIYVFDGDTNTNVVCEGYAKAFQYLCDLSSFTGTVSSALVTGTMTGGTGEGLHMWNVVTIGGANYLVDVTNCDDGTVGAPKQLFLCGVREDTPNKTYTAVIDTSNSVTYEYDKETLENYNPDELALSTSAYTPSKPAPTITFSSSYLYGFDIIYSGSPITAGKNGVSLSYVPDLRYHYAGGSETPVFTVEWLKVDGGTEISMGTDPQNGPTEVGSYKLRVTAAETTTHSEATAEQPFQIITQRLDDETTVTVTLTVATGATYDGAEKNVVVNVTYTLGSSTTLEKGKDYTVDGTLSATDAGEYEVTVTGMGNYGETVKKTWTINRKDITSNVKIDGIPDQPYTGEPITPEVVVTDDGGNKLVKDKDYTVTYGENKAVGTGKVFIKAKADGNYSFGDLTANFTITAKPATITIAEPGTITYDGAPVEAGASGKDLNYTYTGDASTITVKWYADNNGAKGDELTGAPKDAGTYWIGVSAAAGSTYGAVGEVTRQFTIARADYTFLYSGTPTIEMPVGTPKPTTNSTSTATHIGTDIVSGTISWFTDASLTTPASGSFDTVGSTVELWWRFEPGSTTKNYVTTTKTGKAIFKVIALPLQSATFADAGPISKTFGEGSFTNAATNSSPGGGAITYAGNNDAVATVEASTGAVTIHGVGTVTITATAAEVPTKLAKTAVSYTLTVSPKTITPTISLSESTFTYDGNEKTPAVTVKYDETELKLGTDYTVSGKTSATDADTYTITVTCKGNYEGTASVDWTINRAAPKQEDFTITGLDIVDYDGKPKTVSVVPKPGISGMGEVTVKYADSTTAPTDVGSYVVTIEIADTGANYTKATITAGTLTIKAKDISGFKAIAYDQSTAMGNGNFTEPVVYDAAGKPLEGSIVYYGYDSGPNKSYSDIVNMLKSLTTKTGVTLQYTFTPSSSNYIGSKTGEFFVTVLDIVFTVEGGATADASTAIQDLTSGDTTYGRTWNERIRLKPITAKAGETVIPGVYTIVPSVGSLTDRPKVNTNTYQVEFISKDDTNVRLSVFAAAATLVISPKPVTVSGITAANKVYDGTDTATVKTDNAIFNGILEGDALSITATGTFADANAGDNKTVNLSLGALSGADAANYTLAASGNQSATTASITKANLILNTPTGLTATYGDKLSSITLTNPSGNASGTWSWMDDTQSVGDASDTPKDFEARFTPTDTTNYATQEGLLVSVTVNKAAAPSAPTGLFGIMGQALSTVTLPNGWTWVNSTTMMDTAGEQTFTANYAGDKNHHSANNVNITVNVKDKSDVSGNITFNNGTLTYNGAGQSYEMAAISGISASGTAKWTYTYAVSGTGTLDGGLPKTVGTYTVTARYEDDASIGTKSAVLTITAKKIAAPAADATVYAYTGGAQTYKIAASADYTVSGGTQTNANESGYTVTVALTDKANTAWTDGTTADKTYSFKIMKAAPTGTPAYTAINASGKTLADAALAVGGITPTGGTITWDMASTTLVAANTAYGWTYTPTDTANYNKLTGSITLYVVAAPPSGGSSSGGGSSSSDQDTSDSGTVKTETTKNNDGSTTRTETKRDGTVVETTTGKDGSVSKTETKKDGSSVTENKAADGSTGTVKTDKYGQTEAETTLSSKAVEEAKRNGEPVKAPVEVEAARNSDSAPTVKIELPKSAGDTKVEIPVTNVKPGTVAVLVHPDGTEEIIKDSIPTENGVQLTVSGGATVKILDNSKDFGDIQSHWAKDAIDFVSARGLVNGINPSLYSPNASATRAQLWTILARQSDAELNGGNTWYENAQNWAKDKGISDGADPNGTINRAQMVTMLWRAMGEPVAEITHSFTDIAADNYYAQAVAWAVRNGITTGVGDGRFDPNGACTRGQIAAFLMRYCSAK